MLYLKGKGVFGGVTIGTLSVMRRSAAEVKRYSVCDTEAETQRFHTARKKAHAALGVLYDKAVADVGKDNAAIFEIHQMMLEDLDYIESVEGIIRSQEVNAEYAVNATAENFAQIFSSMEDSYMQARAADVKDISARVLEHLGCGGQTMRHAGDKFIIAADDLAPSETVQLDKNKVLGFVTSGGSVNSHTAILARTIGIPAVIGVGKEIGAGYAGKIAVVDGYTGEVFIDPDEATLQKMQEKQRLDIVHKQLLNELKGAKSITKSGRQVNVYANIGNTGDLASVLENDAEGIGLFRSEFIYLENNDYPTEEQQFAIYKLAVESMAGKRVIIRTLDIGADKQASYFNLPAEENPALGFRAVRICLERPEIFKTQLRALCRASVYGKLAIMFPMIISVEEVRRCKDILKQVQQELAAEKIAYDAEMEIGIMIETPAAALISGDLAREVDFFSIGTNDLSQYTLAIDRQNQSLDAFFNPHHPAVLKLIELTVESAHKAGIWAGICGELGGDLTLTERFVRMGVDELSVAPASVLPLRKKIRSLD